MDFFAGKGYTGIKLDLNHTKMFLFASLQNDSIPDKTTYIILYYITLFTDAL